MISRGKNDMMIPKSQSQIFIFDRGKNHVKYEAYLLRSKSTTSIYSGKINAPLKNKENEAGLFCNKDKKRGRPEVIMCKNGVKKIIPRTHCANEFLSMCSSNSVKETYQKDFSCQTNKAPHDQRLVNDVPRKWAWVNSVRYENHYSIPTEWKSSLDCKVVGQTADWTDSVPCWTNERHIGKKNSYKCWNLNGNRRFEKYFNTRDRRDLTSTCAQMSKERNEMWTNLYAPHRLYSLPTKDAKLSCEDTSVAAKSCVLDNIKQQPWATARKKNPVSVTKLHLNPYCNEASSDYPACYKVSPFTRHHVSNTHTALNDRTLKKSPAHSDRAICNELLLRERRASDPKYTGQNFSRAKTSSESASTSPFENSRSSITKMDDEKKTYGSNILHVEGRKRYLRPKNYPSEDTCVDTGRTCTALQSKYDRPKTITESNNSHLGFRAGGDFSKVSGSRFSIRPYNRMSIVKATDQSLSTRVTFSHPSNETTGCSKLRDPSGYPLIGNSRYDLASKRFNTRWRESMESIERRSLAAENYFLERAFSAGAENLRRRASSQRPNLRLSNSTSSLGDTSIETRDKYPTVIFPRADFWISLWADDDDRGHHFKIVRKEKAGRLNMQYTSERDKRYTEEEPGKEVDSDEDKAGRSRKERSCWRCKKWRQIRETEVKIPKHKESAVPKDEENDKEMATETPIEDNEEESFKKDSSPITKEEKRGRKSGPCTGYRSGGVENFSKQLKDENQRREEEDVAGPKKVDEEETTTKKEVEGKQRKDLKEDTGTKEKQNKSTRETAQKKTEQGAEKKTEQGPQKTYLEEKPVAKTEPKTSEIKVKQRDEAQKNDVEPEKRREHEEIKSHQKAETVERDVTDNKKNNHSSVNSGSSKPIDSTKTDPIDKKLAEKKAQPPPPPKPQAAREKQSEPIPSSGAVYDAAFRFFKATGMEYFAKVLLDQMDSMKRRNKRLKFVAPRRRGLYTTPQPYPLWIYPNDPLGLYKYILKIRGKGKASGVSCFNGQGNVQASGLSRCTWWRPHTTAIEPYVRSPGRTSRYVTHGVSSSATSQRSSMTTSYSSSLRYSTQRSPCFSQNFIAGPRYLSPGLSCISKHCEFQSSPYSGKSVPLGKRFCVCPDYQQCTKPPFAHGHNRFIGPPCYYGSPGKQETKRNDQKAFSMKRKPNICCSLCQGKPGKFQDKYVSYFTRSSNTVTQRENLRPVKPLQVSARSDCKLFAQITEDLSTQTSRRKKSKLKKRRSTRRRKLKSAEFRKKMTTDLDKHSGSGGTFSDHKKVLKDTKFGVFTLGTKEPHLTPHISQKSRTSLSYAGSQKSFISRASIADVNKGYTGIRKKHKGKERLSGKTSRNSISKNRFPSGRSSRKSSKTTVRRKRSRKSANEKDKGSTSGFNQSAEELGGLSHETSDKEMIPETSKDSVGSRRSILRSARTSLSKRARTSIYSTWGPYTRGYSAARRPFFENSRDWQARRRRMSEASSPRVAHAASSNTPRATPASLSGVNVPPINISSESFVKYEGSSRNIISKSAIKSGGCSKPGSEAALHSLNPSKDVSWKFPLFFVDTTKTADHFIKSEKLPHNTPASLEVPSTTKQNKLNNVLPIFKRLSTGNDKQPCMLRYSQVLKNFRKKRISRGDTENKSKSIRLQGDKIEHTSGIPCDQSGKMQRALLKVISATSATGNCKEGYETTWKDSQVNENRAWTPSEDHASDEKTQTADSTSESLGISKTSNALSNYYAPHQYCRQVISNTSSASLGITNPLIKHSNSSHKFCQERDKTAATSKSSSLDRDSTAKLIKESKTFQRRNPSPIFLRTKPFPARCPSALCSTPMTGQNRDQTPTISERKAEQDRYMTSISLQNKFCQVRDCSTLNSKTHINRDVDTTTQAPDSSTYHIRKRNTHGFQYKTYPQRDTSALVSDCDTFQSKTTTFLTTQNEVGFRTSESIQKLMSNLTNVPSATSVKRQPFKPCNTLYNDKTVLSFDPDIFPTKSSPGYFSYRRYRQTMATGPPEAFRLRTLTFGKYGGHFSFCAPVRFSPFSNYTPGKYAQPAHISKSSHLIRSSVLSAACADQS